MAKVLSCVVAFIVLFSLIINESQTKLLKDVGYEKYETLSYLPRLDATDEFSIHTRTRRQEPDSNPSTVVINKKLLPAVAPSASTSSKIESPSTDEKQPLQPVQQQRTNSRMLGDVSMNGTVDTPAGVLNANRPLLGVNGTGQRKDLPMPGLQGTRQTIVSEPIKPEEHITNMSTSSTSNVTNSAENDDWVDNVDAPQDETEKLYKKNNFTVKEDDHKYYSSLMSVDYDFVKKYWGDFKDFKTDNLLSKSYRRAITVQLSFNFPFYGHPLRNITVATGGFVYTGDYVHSWLAATQYIAPLMANFDTRQNDDSFVRYYDNGTAFTVLWENVQLQEHRDYGNFTFTATLHNTGNIVFTYLSVPVSIHLIHDDNHPVKVGLSDAYIIDKVIIFARRKTIFEYHRVNFDHKDIQNGTIININAEPTCLYSKDCNSCVTAYLNIKCYWCPTVNRCSSGTDRKRQDWLQKGCDKVQITEEAQCPKLGTTGNNAENEPDEVTFENVSTDRSHMFDTHDSEEEQDDKSSSDVVSALTEYEEEGGARTAKLLYGVFVPIVLVSLILIWVLYAYRNPHSKSGQFLILYRPSQWSWRRGEARYTAATIHM